MLYQYGLVSMKRIQFIRPLVERIREGKVVCTYRKDPRAYSGEYQVITSRFQKKTNSDLFIEVYPTEKFVVSELRENDARLAGCPLKPEELLPHGAKRAPHNNVPLECPYNTRACNASALVHAHGNRCSSIS